MATGLNSFASGSNVESERGEVEVVLREAECGLGGVADSLEEVDEAPDESPFGGVYQRELWSPPFPLFCGRVSRVNR